MKPDIRTLPETKFVGQRYTMSLTANKTYELWRNFMPRRKEIQHITGIELYSIEVYAPSYFDHFNPDATFEKWAAVKVTDFKAIPDGMETLSAPEGLYAVFTHKGPASEGHNTYQYIFGTWLPGSGYLPDNRPHLAIMGEKYKHEDPNSEEELWIPVKPKPRSI